MSKRPVKALKIPREVTRPNVIRQMKLLVNGVNLFFDVEGSSLRVQGEAMREVPTVILTCSTVVPARTIRSTNPTSPR